ncbi:MAG: hypothetical protein K5945_07510 [Bacteroidaceae bacterium]|nr:hypothetical protein [Bacteroidaceae bacterium]
MKKMLIAASGLLLLWACTPKGQSHDEAMLGQIDSLQRLIDEKDVELNDIMGSINEVQEGMRRINEAQGRVTIADGNRESASSKEVIRENMEFIQEALQQNRDMIAQLKEKLRNSTLHADKLAKAIENLQQQVDDQARQIQELKAQLAEKDAQLAEQGEQINALSAENTAKGEKISAQDAELHKAWFVFGTASELREQKILAKGDVLKSGDFNKDYFTQIDIRYDKDIKFYSKSAKMLTSHPSGSYNLVKDKQGQYELHITDPTKFWSVSKYLVVQVK